MPAGRPTKMTPETVSKLEEAFSWGCTDTEACLFADISRQTLNKYQQKHPEFVDRKERLKSNPVMLAKKIQLADLLGGDSQIAQKVIERKEGKKVNVAGADGTGPVEIKMVEYVIADPEDSGS